MQMPSANVELGQHFALDLAPLGNLRRAAVKDQQAALHTVAQQFEALFLDMMIKQMRQSLPGDELFGSSTVTAYQQMFDQQLSQKLATGKGIGLAEALVRQLSTAQVERLQGT